MSVTRFLLVEDDKNDVALMEEQFRTASGIELRWVSDGAEAVRYLRGEVEYADRDKFPIPDVILLDLKMPRFSGFDFLEWLHHKSPDHQRLIPVVVMSSSNDPNDIRRAYALGANSYMVKPVTWKEFQARVQALGLYWAEHSETPHLPAPERSLPGVSAGPDRPGRESR
jgi:CheY-like chemotaxis protein